MLCNLNKSQRLIVLSCWRLLCPRHGSPDANTKIQPQQVWAEDQNSASLTSIPGESVAGGPWTTPGKGLNGADKEVIIKVKWAV